MPQWLKVWGILFYSFTFVYLFVRPHLGHMFCLLNPSYSFKARTFYFTNYLYMFLIIIAIKYLNFFFTSGVIFFQLFNWIQLLFCEKKSENCKTVRTGQKWPFFERGCRWFQLFSLIFSCFIFYPESFLVT